MNLFILILINTYFYKKANCFKVAKQNTICYFLKYNPFFINQTPSKVIPESCHLDNSDLNLKTTYYLLNNICSDDLTPISRVVCNSIGERRNGGIMIKKDRQITLKLALCHRSK